MKLPKHAPAKRAAAEYQPRADDEELSAGLEKLVYLRGPQGQRDRDTLYALGLGTLAGTAEGGLVEGWLEGEKNV